MFSQSTHAHSVFIPFIRLGVTEEDVRFVFTNQGLGKVTSIEIHEKKMKKDGKLKSANHYYAFISVKPERSEVGDRFVKNIKDGKTTHIMYEGCGLSLRWEVKPHLSIKERTDRGFSLLPETVKIQEQDVDVSEAHEEDDESILSEISRIESDDDEVPEWMNTTMDDLATPWKSLHEFEAEHQNIQKLSLQLLTPPSFFDCVEERADILNDYNDLNNDICRIQTEVREYNMWTSIEIL